MNEILMASIVRLMIKSASFGILLVVLVWGAIELFSSDEIKLPHRLEPIRTEITCDSIKCDTTYVYLNPNP